MKTFIMDQEQARVRQLANIASTVLHPYLVFSLAVALVSYQSDPSISVWAKWTAVALLSAYMLPVSYMQIKMALAARTSGTKISFRPFFREKPNEMLLLACLFGIPSALVLYLLGAPHHLTATVVAVAITSVLIALVNRVYRASFHLSLFTSMIIPVAIVFGPPALIAVSFLVPLLGVSRYLLGEHTPLQLVTGFLLGLVVTTAIFLVLSLIL